MSATKTHSFSIFNLAKHLLLPGCEKTTIVGIADHVRKIDGYCNAAVETLARELGTSDRRVQHGIHGRKKKDGTKYNQGLLERGLIYVDTEFSAVNGGRSNPTVYRVNLGEWLKYLPEAKHIDVQEVLKGRPKGEQTPNKGRTTQSERVNNSENDAPVSPLDASKGRPKGEILRTKPLKKENQKIETSTPDDELEQSRRPLMEEIQKSADKILGATITTAKKDPKCAKDFETRFGREVLLRAWEIWLSDSKNLYLPDGSDRLFLFSHFVEGGQAGVIAEWAAPIVGDGFKDPDTINQIHSYGMEIGADLLPEEIAFLEAEPHLSELYADFCNRNRGGSLKDLAANHIQQRTPAVEHAA